MADGVADRRALLQLRLGVLVADAAGQAGVQGAVAVGEGLVYARLACGVVVVVAVGEHALARRADGARRAAARHLVEEEVVVAHTDGVVGVGARRLHAHQASAQGAGQALLGDAVVLREGLAWRRRCGDWRGEEEEGGKTVRGGNTRR